MHAINNKIFFLADVLFLQGQLRFEKQQFSLADIFYLGDHLRLELSCIWVNTMFSDSACESHNWQDVFPVLFL